MRSSYSSSWSLFLGLVGLVLSSELVLADETALPISSVSGAEVDVFVVQDTTESYAGKFANIAAGLEAGFKVLPVGSKMGLVEMKDKPFNNLGLPTDFCYHSVSSLSVDYQSQLGMLGGLVASGGGDEADAQFAALAETVIHAEWSADYTITVPRTHGQGEEERTHHHRRLLIMNTDSRGHSPNDYKQYVNNTVIPLPRPPFFLEAFPLLEHILPEATAQIRCTMNDYPAPVFVAQYIHHHNAHVIFIIPETAHQAIGVWTGFNKGLLSQPDAFLQVVKDDYSDYDAKLSIAINAYLNWVPHHDHLTTTTTTPATTTTATTTTPAITTTATTTPETTTLATTPETTTPATTTLATTAETTPATTTLATTPETTTPATTTTETTTLATTPETTTPAATTAATTPETTTLATTTPATTTPETTTPATTVATTTPETTTLATTLVTTTTLATTPASTTLATTNPSTTVTTIASTLSASSIESTSTAPVAVVTTAGGVETTVSVPTKEAGCDGRPALVVRVNARPARLVLDYEA